MNIQKIIILFLLLASIFSSCQEKNKYIPITLESFADMADPAYHVDADLLSEGLRHEVMADTDRETPDIQARRHYLDGGPLVWVTLNGVSAKADTLLTYLATVDSIGFSIERFCYSSLRDDLKRARNLDFDPDKHSRNNINKVYARLEYRLTKAFLRYAEGMRFGFVNPYDAFNRLDVRDSSDTYRSYRSLYDVPTKRPDAKFVAEAFRVMSSDGAAVGAFLSASHPENPLYTQFYRRLRQPLSASERRRVLCNMERSRWRHGDYPQLHKKRVVVNIPSLHLVATDGDEHLTMRIGLGSLKTKTPLLTSRIKRMDFNPQWIIPKSIIKTSVRHNAGNTAYFESHDYFIRQRSTGKEVDPANVTADMLMSPDYLVIQRGGDGNSLGRIIFRFDNDYSIYLHDTSNRNVFSRNNRSVSHGCIRVEKPYDLAVFMLADKNEALMKKIEYSMTVKYGRHRTEDDDINNPINRRMMLRSLKVEPQVPVFITYYTLYPDTNGTLIGYDDIYGYDPVIYRRIQKYM